MVSKRNATARPADQQAGGKINLAQLKALMMGLWLYLLLDLAPQLEDAIHNLGRHVPCPFHGGKDGFRLFSDAAETGGGVCNTCGSFADGIALLRKANGWTMGQTLEAISAWHTKNRNLKPAEKAPSKGPGIDPQAKKILDGIANGFEDDPGRVAEYLRSRGLLGDVPEVLKLHQGLPLYEDGTCVDTLPAMVAPYQRLDGQVVGYQRTYLDPEGPGKARVANAKKNTGPLWKGAIAGALIRLGEVGGVLGIAEGIETALAVQQATGITVWAAGSAGGMETAEIPQEIKTLYIWADNDKNGRGEKTALKLAERLLKEGRTVYVAIPQQPGCDWLDVLNQQGEGAVREGMEEAVCYELAENEADFSAQVTGVGESCEGKDADQIIDELNRHHFVVNVGGKVCIANLFYDPQMEREDLTLSSVQDFKYRYSNRFFDPDTTIAELWWSSPRRRQYHSIVFMPGQDVAGYFNLFRGFPIEPIPGDCSLYWQHTRDHVCDGNEEHYRFVRRWMAHSIQHPQQLPGTAIVLRGLQGTGKGVFVENFGALFGIHYVSVYRLDQVTGRFNSHLKNVLLLHANEATCRNDKVGEGVLKGLITDPYVPVEHKGKDIINLRNYKRIIVATNEEWAVPMGMDDRRYLVVDVNPAKKENKAYFRAIEEQMASGGLQALMYDLLTEDLSDFDVRTVPFSPSNFGQKLHSAAPIIQWWYDALCDGRTVGVASGASPDGWNLHPTHEQLFQAYANWCRESRLTPQSKPMFGRAFRKLLPGLTVGESRRVVGSGQAGWGEEVRRQRCYILPTLQECREAFQRYSKSGPEIWPEESQED